ncbi:hypothetical protein MHH57_21425 [Paenibacillus sp. FSL H7-0442]|uniref:hypothetical protein n=1 Tax=Paenibacillus sp. FSL H7-0442 TaxID=2921435 RepID=UPI003158562E
MDLSSYKKVAEKEAITNSKTLQLLGVPLKVGAPLTLRLEIHGKEVKRDLILSGWWESNPTANTGQIFTSSPYVDAHADELQSTYSVEDKTMIKQEL